MDSCHSSTSPLTLTTASSAEEVPRRYSSDDYGSSKELDFHSLPEAIILGIQQWGHKKGGRSKSFDAIGSNQLGTNHSIGSPRGRTTSFDVNATCSAGGETGTIACNSYNCEEINKAPPPPLCGICFDTITTGEDESQCRCPDCSATFCIRCQAMHVAAKVNDRMVTKEELICPDIACHTPLLPETHPHLFLDAHVLNLYRKCILEKDVASDVTKQWCSTMDCRAVLSGTSRRLTCAECSSSTCRKCGLPYHYLSSCHSNMDTSFKSWTHKKNAQRCPSCSFWIEKNAGCDHMTCSMCKHQFCWVCGVSWNIHSNAMPCAYHKLVAFLSSTGVCRLPLVIKVPVFVIGGTIAAAGAVTSAGLAVAVGAITVPGYHLAIRPARALCKRVEEQRRIRRRNRMSALRVSRASGTWYYPDQNVLLQGIDVLILDENLCVMNFESFRSEMEALSGRWSSPNIFTSYTTCGGEEAIIRYHTTVTDQFHDGLHQLVLIHSDREVDHTINYILGEEVKEKAMLSLGLRDTIEIVYLAPMVSVRSEELVGFNRNGVVTNCFFREANNRRRTSYSVLRIPYTNYYDGPQFLLPDLMGMAERIVSRLFAAQ